MTAQSKLDAARSALSGTNSSVTEFERKFAGLYGVEDINTLSEDDLGDARFEDIESCGVPTIIARRIARIFRNGDVEDSSPTKETVVKVDISNDPEKHAATLTPVQLVEHFDPDNSTNPYGTRLKTVTEGRKCLAYGKDGSFNIPLSKQLVQEIVDGYPEREEVILDEVPLPTYSVGDRPDRYADENPVEHGTPLRPDGSSDAGCEWGAVALNIRQLVYLAVDSGETEDEEQDIFDKIDGKSYAQVAKRFRKAAVELHEREKIGTLPQLKIRLGGNRSGGRRGNNPFGEGHKVW